jgi:hypothetical protein
MSEGVAGHVAVTPFLPVTYEHGGPYEDVENHQEHHDEVMASLMPILGVMTATVRLGIATTNCQSVARGWCEEEGRFSVLRDRGVLRWGRGGVGGARMCSPD